MVHTSDSDVLDNSQSSKPLSDLSIAVSVFREKISTTRTSSSKRTVSVVNDSEAYKNMIESLGGTFQTAISRSTTHLLFLKGKIAKKARERDLKVVSCKWIEACFDSNSHVGEQDYIVDVTGTDAPRHIKRSRKSEDCLPIDNLPNPNERCYSSSQMLKGDESSDDQKSLFGHNEGPLNFGELSP